MTLASVFEPLLRRLDAAYTEMNALFRENDMDQCLLQPRSYAEMKTWRLGEKKGTLSSWTCG